MLRVVRDELVVPFEPHFADVSGLVAPRERARVVPFRTEKF